MAKGGDISPKDIGNDVLSVGAGVNADERGGEGTLVVARGGASSPRTSTDHCGHPARDERMSATISLTGSSVYLCNASTLTILSPGGSDIYAGSPLTPSCFIFKK